MSKEAVISRCMSLVQLAGSDNENEARNAALLACRLIREEKLVLTAAPPKTTAPAATHPVGPDPACDECAGEGFYYFSGQRHPCSCVLRSAPHVNVDAQPTYADLQELQRREKTAQAAREILNRGRGTPSSTASPASPKRPRPIVMADAVHTPVEITAKFQGKCQDCGDAYAQGDKVLFRRGVGCVHKKCDPAALV